MGYSSAGMVIAVGDGVSDIRVGDRVACAGAGYAVHAEFACVPRMLVAKIPEDANDPRRKFPTKKQPSGRWARFACTAFEPREVALGDTVAVIGLGLLGQITVQLLKAAGCRVFGMDLLRQRADLAIASGAEAACTAARASSAICVSRKRAAWAWTRC